MGKRKKGRSVVPLANDRRLFGSIRRRSLSPGRLLVGPFGSCPRPTRFRVPKVVFFHHVPPILNRRAGPVPSPLGGVGTTPATVASPRLTRR